jgi:hypothetical protein
MTETFRALRAVLARWGSYPTPIPMDKLDRLIALDRDDPANALPASKK